MFKPIRTFYFIMLALALQIISLRAWAGGEGLEMPEALERKVPLEGLTGISLFFAQTYNDNLILYALLCTILMAAVGMAIAYVTDWILKLIGLEVGKIEHKE